MVPSQARTPSESFYEKMRHVQGGRIAFRHPAYTGSAALCTTSGQRRIEAVWVRVVLHNGKLPNSRWLACSRGSPGSALLCARCANVIDKERLSCYFIMLASHVLLMFNYYLPRFLCVAESSGSPHCYSRQPCSQPMGST